MNAVAEGTFSLTKMEAKARARTIDHYGRVRFRRQSYRGEAGQLRIIIGHHFIAIERSRPETSNQ
ncbi:hypothetical protein AOG23_14775 [Rhizobium acidisoli]|nr:hypothetical protein AOG23_14775 [Rhizobium acidisoli]